MSNSEVKTDAVEFEVSMDFKAFSGFHKNYILVKNGLKINVAFVIPLIAAALFFSVQSVPEGSKLPYVLPFTVVQIGLIILVPYLIRKSITNAYRSNRHLYEKVLYRVDDKVILIKGETNDRQIQLTDIVEYKDFEEYIFLTNSKDLILYIPKSSLQDDQLHTLLAILGENVTSK